MSATRPFDITVVLPTLERQHCPAALFTDIAAAAAWALARWPNAQKISIEAAAPASQPAARPQPRPKTPFCSFGLLEQPECAQPAPKPMNGALGGGAAQRHADLIRAVRLHCQQATPEGRSRRSWAERLAAHASHIARRWALGG